MIGSAREKNHEIFDQEIHISVDSFVTMRLCGTPTETPLFQHGRSLLPVTDCQLLCSGRWPSKLKKSKLCSFSLVETSRLKRSATFNWTRFLRWSSQLEQVGLEVFVSKDIELKFLSAEISMESLASLFLGPWSPNFWLTQASTQLVSIHIIWEIWKSSFFSPSGRLRPHFLTVCRPNVTLTSTEVSWLG